jgi:ring-1,2-phenylacetyl-CoA epoxidase subunit PaaE
MPLKTDLLMKFYDLEIATLTQETPESRVLSFHVPEALKSEFAFQAGQYLTLEREGVRRSYSLCDVSSLSVGIKTIEGGAFSTLPFKAGETVRVLPPQGRFCLPSPLLARHILLIAAGSGITPMVALAQDLLENHPQTSVTVIYGNKNTASIMFRETLENLKDRFMQRFILTHILTREASDIPLLHGRLTAQKIEKLLATTTKPDLAFLCGPQNMVEEGAKLLQKLGLAPEQVKKELFTTTTPPRVKREGVETPDIALTLTLDGQSYFVNMAQDETVLETALRNGLDLPYSCKGGMCCTCRAHVESGEAEMAVNYSLEPWEIARGFTLTCQARALGKTLHINYDAV